MASTVVIAATVEGSDAAAVVSDQPKIRLTGKKELSDMSSAEIDTVLEEKFGELGRVSGLSKYDSNTLPILPAPHRIVVHHHASGLMGRVTDWGEKSYVNAGTLFSIRDVCGFLNLVEEDIQPWATSLFCVLSQGINPDYQGERSYTMTTGKMVSPLSGEAREETTKRAWKMMMDFVLAFVGNELFPGPCCGVVWNPKPHGSILLRICFDDSVRVTKEYIEEWTAHGDFKNMGLAQELIDCSSKKKPPRRGGGSGGGAGGQKRRGGRR